MKLKTTPWHLECHNCHGEGSIEWTATSWNGNQSSSRGHSETCEYCNGEGSYEIPGWVSEKDISECCPTYFRKEDIEDFLDPEALAQFKGRAMSKFLEFPEELLESAVSRSNWSHEASLRLARKLLDEHFHGSGEILKDVMRHEGLVLELCVALIEENKARILTEEDDDE